MTIERKKFTDVDTTEMTSKEAMQCTKKIKTKSMELQKALLDFYLRKGYEVMGYGSFKEYCVEEVTNASYDSLNNTLNAAKITLDMAGIERVGRYSSYALSPLKSRSYAERREFYKFAQKESGKEEVPSKFLTQNFVKHALVDLGHDQSTKPDKNDNEHSTYSDEPSSQLNNNAQTNFERKFKSAWKGTSETTKFSKRIVNTISVSAKPKLIATICLHLLEEHFEGDKVERAIKVLTKAIRL
jgi:hypothetical protein